MPDPTLTDPSWAKVATDWALFGLGAIGTGVAAVWAWRRRAEHGRAAELTDIRADVGALDARVVDIEGRLKVLPDGARCAAQAERMATLEARVGANPGRADIGRIHQRIDDLTHTIGAVQVQVGEMRGEIHASTRLLQTIDAHLRTPRT